MSGSIAVDSETTAGIASRVDATAVSIDPGPHLVLRDLLPEPVYASLLAAIPPPESFDVADSVKADFDPLLSTRAPIESNVFTPGPPPQWPMPGAMNRRIQSLWFLPILLSTES
jgi:hypothetical protein